MHVDLIKKLTHEFYPKIKNKTCSILFYMDCAIKTFINVLILSRSKTNSSVHNTVVFSLLKKINVINALLLFILIDNTSTF